MNSEKFNISSILDCINKKQLSDVTLNLQAAVANQVVFYKIRESATSLDLFLKRLNSSKFGILIINRHIEEVSSLANVFECSEDDFDKIQKDILDKFYPLVRSEVQTLKIVGVTGTNGKTTVVNLSRQISSMLGFKALSLGTLGIFDGEKKVPFEVANTTPSYMELRKIIYRYRKFDVLFMEVSSHALFQNRLGDLKLDGAAFTNFTQDHLDYHNNMENYFEAKRKIVKYLKSERYLVLSNRDQDIAQRLNNCGDGDKIKKAQELDKLGINTFDLPYFFKAPYNIENLEISLELNNQLWRSTEELELKKLTPPEGRFFPIFMKNGGVVIIDYAHTPDALLSVSRAIRSSLKGDLHILFGCGGDRDRPKRKKMGKIASDLGDFVYITSDNPRFEDPNVIISEIVEGVIKKETKLFIEERREVAIQYAFSKIRGGDVLLVVGKGHEEYQERRGKKLFFSDRQVVSRLCERQ